MCALACEDCEATFPVALILRRAVRIAVEREYHKPQKAARLYSRGKPLGFAPVRESSRNASACAHTQGIGKCKVCTGVFAWHDHRAPRDHGPRSNCPGPTSYRPEEEEEEPGPYLLLPLSLLPPLRPYVSPSLKCTQAISPSACVGRFFLSLSFLPSSCVSAFLSLHPSLLLSALLRICLSARGEGAAFLSLHPSLP